MRTTNMGRIGGLLTLLATASLAGCHNASTAPLVAGSVTEIAGDSQTVVVGANTTPLSVRVIATDGEMMAGVTVEWSVISGSGTLSTTSSVTDAQGVATASFMPTSSGTNVIAAVAQSLSTPVDFTVIATNPPDSTASDTTSTSGN